MKLITEEIEQAEYIVEETNGKKNDRKENTLLNARKSN